MWALFKNKLTEEWIKYKLNSLWNLINNGSADSLVSPLPNNNLSPIRQLFSAKKLYAPLDIICPTQNMWKLAGEHSGLLKVVRLKVVVNKFIRPT